MDLIKAELTELEFKALMELLDLAVKAGGMRVAPAALALSQKFMREPIAPPKE